MGPPPLPTEAHPFIPTHTRPPPPTQPPSHPATQPPSHPATQPPSHPATQPPSQATSHASKRNCCWLLLTDWVSLTSRGQIPENVPSCRPCPHTSPCRVPKRCRSSPSHRRSHPKSSRRVPSLLDQVMHPLWFQFLSKLLPSPQVPH